MKVITGSTRGKRLVTPEGLDTRPTTDRVKESVFNIVQFHVPGARVLDLFAGSGQMGIEALSRGAVFCVFADKDKQAQKAIGTNLKNTGFAGQSRVFAGDSFAALESLRDEKFDLIFLDPPYGGQMLNAALKKICLFDNLRSGGIIICESAQKDEIEPLEAPYCVKKEYHYGKIKLTAITREDGLA